MIQVYYNNVLHDVLDNEIEYSRLHREGDEPAIICENGSKIWYKNGQLHREGDLPAYIDANGNKYWFKNGQYHREGDLPAYIDVNGSKKWYKNDNEYIYFNLPDLFHFQLLLIFMFNIKKNKQSFHPDNLIGKLIKIDLYLLFEK